MEFSNNIGNSSRKYWQNFKGIFTVGIFFFFFLKGNRNELASGAVSLVKGQP